MHQPDVYRPTISDFVEGLNFAGPPDRIDHYARPQEASPLAQYPQFQPRWHSSATQVTALSPPSWNIVCAQRGFYLPTPPYSPHQLTHGKHSDLLRTTSQSLASYSSLSATSSSDNRTPSLATPISRTIPVLGSRFLDSSLIQALELDQSPNKFIVSADDGIDPFVDQTEDTIPDKLQNAAPTAMLSYAPFKPSRALLDLPRTVDPELAHMAQRVGIDLEGNYKGDITKEHIYNAIAPVSDNCALHIIGLPADIALKEVFSVIVGKVFSFQLHAPVPGKWNGCGARLVFTNRAAAEEFYWKSRIGVGIIIRGQQIRVLWNRDPCRPQHYADRHQSRVLQIKGPNVPNFSAEGTEQFFASKLLFQLVERKEWLEAGGLKVVELHFPSILGQSRPAMKQFYEMLDDTDQRSVFKIKYAPDPCDTPIQATTWWEELSF